MGRLHEAWALQVPGLNGKMTLSNLPSHITPPKFLLTEHCVEVIDTNLGKRRGICVTGNKGPKDNNSSMRNSTSPRNGNPSDKQAPQKTFSLSLSLSEAESEFRVEPSVSSPFSMWSSYQGNTKNRLCGPLSASGRRARYFSALSRLAVWRELMSLRCNSE